MSSAWPSCASRWRSWAGSPTDDSGPWGAFARLVEGGAKMFGEKAAISALEEGEDHGLKLYRDEIGKLDFASRRSWRPACCPRRNARTVR